MSDHYDQNYFAWQQRIGELTGSATRFIYQDFIKPTDVVLDFGCGGGYILSGIPCARRLGIEINPHAAQIARGNGLTVFGNLQEVTERPDVIISSHALEHTHEPLEVLRTLARILKPGGRLVLVTPYERNVGWKPGDINNHLFTWSPMNLGNLATLAGFQVDDCQVIYHRFPPRSQAWHKLVGPTAFHYLARLWGRVYGKVRQVRLVAHT